MLYVFAQVQDVTAQRAVESDLRRSEENFRRLVTAVGEYAIFMLDVDGMVVSWNSGAQRIKGYLASEIMGRHFRVFYPPEDQESGHPEHNLEMALREGSFAEEGWRVRKDGSRFWASVVITPVYDDAGRARRVRQGHPRPDPAAGARGGTPNGSSSSGSTCWPSPPTSCATRRP